MPTVMNASEFENIFDNDDSILDFLDLSKTKRILQEHNDVDIEVTSIVNETYISEPSTTI